MQENTDLGQITDIAQLEALKSDQYQHMAQLNTNLAVINRRIAQIIQDNATSPAENVSEAAGAGHMEEVSLNVTTPGEAA